MDYTPSAFVTSRRLVVRNPLPAIGALILLLMTLMALAAPLLAKADPVAHNVRNRMAPPSVAHPLGTDQYGRDVFSRVVHGTGISLSVGAVATATAVLAGTFVGMVSGYRLGYTDTVVMRFMEVMMAVPAILLAIGILAVLGPGKASVILALAIVYMPRVARLVRGAVIACRQWEFVEAARSMGCSESRIMWRHVLPQAMGPILVQATITFAYAILAEATLSFLGLGVPPPAPSLGNIINDGSAILYHAPWVALFAGSTISLTVLGINLLGDGLRDLLDPRIR